MSDFFEPPPPLEPEPRQEWDGPPPAVLPATVPIERIVARTDAAVIYLAAISVYATGFEFDIVVLTDNSDPDLDLEPFGFEYRDTARRTAEIPKGQLRLGFSFADGSKVTNTGAQFGWHEGSGSPPEAPVMNPSGGRGGEGSWHSSFWVWPLPPPGALEFVCEWPAAGIPLARTELDGGSILDATHRVP